MVSVIWVSLPAHWSLASLQAGLQVVVAILCFVGVFVFARTCWQAASLDLVKNRPVSLPALISIHTLSEAYDAIFLLRFRVFHRKHWKILVQCIIVLVLSASTIVSGPIAKASTRVGVEVRPLEANGLQSNRGFNSYTYGYVQWNQTIQSLNSAGFPSDQLLDFLPDPKYDWVYDQQEWNSSWSMTCTTTESTPITLSDTGNCTNVFGELKGVSDFFAVDDWDYWAVTPFSLYEGFSTKDALLIFTGWTPNVQKTYLGTNNFTFAVAALLMSDLNQRTNANSTCFFATGAIGPSSYTKAQCDIRKIKNIEKLDPNAAYPDHHDLSSVSQAYISHFSPRVARQSGSNVTVSPIPPQELVRFYQAYEVSKDTFRQHPVTRTVSQKIQVPQISATFLALAGLVALLDIMGILNILWFTWRYFDIVWYTPESKLDWAVQSISEEHAPTSAMTPLSSSTSAGPTNLHKRYTVVTSLSSGRQFEQDPASLTRQSIRLRTFFENARYGNHNGHNDGLTSDTIPLTQYPAPSSYLSPDTNNLTSPPNPNSQFHSQSQSQSQQFSSLYNISPYEAQFAAAEEDIAYRPDHHQRQNHVYTSGQNPDYFTSFNNNDNSAMRPWNRNRREYQRLGRPDA